MSGSFERIDYSVRPAKYAERRMLRDIFRRLSPFACPEEYHYVGFGSVWFSDFILFHRALGIVKMTSIESKASAQQRIKDNAPFNIDLIFERSGSALRKLNWKDRMFVWLYYDDTTTNENIADATYVAAHASSGSVLAVTFRASEAKEYTKYGDTLGAATRAFEETFSASLYPDGLADEDLVGYPFATLSRSVLTTAIEAALDARSAPMEPRFSFMPICSFDYADGVLMTTLVGIFFAECDTMKVEKCGFDQLDFLEDRSMPVRIEVPLLTPREIKAVEAQLPLRPEQKINTGSSPEAQVDRLIRLYRYLPNYLVAEV